MTFLPSDLYAQIEQSMPIACVDFVPTRVLSGRREVGLILRESPYGLVWCHLGGRILRGETIKDAIARHALDALDTAPVLDAEPQPGYVYQWFSDEIAPHDGTPFGHDSRKHAIGLSFVVELSGIPRAQNEAIEFAYFDGDALPDRLWPGCRHLLHRLLTVHSS